MKFMVGAVGHFYTAAYGPVQTINFLGTGWGGGGGGRGNQQSATASPGEYDHGEGAGRYL